MAKMTFIQFKKRLRLSGWDGEDKQVVHYDTHSHHSHFEVDGHVVPMGLCIYDRRKGIVHFADQDGALLASDEYFHLKADEEHDYKLFTCVEIR